MSIVYVADTNFFIQAHRVSYPLDVVPSFWNKVKELADSGKIISIDSVIDLGLNIIRHGKQRCTGSVFKKLKINSFGNYISLTDSPR